MNIEQIKKYKKYIDGGIYENGQVERLADRYSQQEQQSISHLDILINSTRANTIYKENIPYKCIVDYGGLPKKSSNTQTMFYREVWTKHSDGIKAGDIVNFKHNPYDISESKTYLFIKTVQSRDGYDMSIMHYCHTTLKWLDEKGKMREVPFCLRSETPTNYGVDEGRILIMPDERRHIFVPKNEFTKKIKKGKRFIFDDRAWKVSVVDGLQDGIITLVLDEDLINHASDNIEERIADYFGNVPSYTVNILNGESFSVRAGKTIQLQAEVKNNGKITNRDVIWSVSDNSIATIDNTGLLSAHANGEVIITVTLVDDPSVYDTSKVTVEFATVNNYSIELDSSLDLLIGATKTFTAIVRNNQVIDSSRTVQFTLYADDGVGQPITSLMTFSSTTQCTLKGLKVGYCKLEVRLVGSSPVFKQVFRIKVESLI